MWLASTLQVTASASIETSCELGNGADPVESPWIMYNDLLCVGDSGLVDDQAVFEARTQTTMQVVDNATVAVETYHATKVVGKLERPAGAVLGGGELMWMEQDLGLVRKCTVSEETGGCWHVFSGRRRLHVDCTAPPCRQMWTAYESGRAGLTNCNRSKNGLKIHIDAGRCTVART